MLDKQSRLDLDHIYVRPFKFVDSCFEARSFMFMNAGNKDSAVFNVLFHYINMNDEW